MKVSSTALVLAIGAANAAAASPIRILSFGDIPEEMVPSPGPARVDTEHKYPVWRYGKPCSHRKHRRPGPGPFVPGPIGSLLSKLGFGSAARPHAHAHHPTTFVEVEIVHADVPHRAFEYTEGESSSHAYTPEEYAQYLRDRIHQIEEEGLPALLPHAGESQVMPGHYITVDEADGQTQRDEAWRNRGWKPKNGESTTQNQHPHHHHHHHHQHEGDVTEGGRGWARGRGRGRMYWRHQHSFGARISHAMRHLSAPEILALIFVLGVGTGSLLHAGIVMFVLFLRFTRRGGMQACRERRAARKAAKAERRAAKRAAKQLKKQGGDLVTHDEGRLRLEGENEVVGVGELPPRYDEDERVCALDEKV